MAEGIWRGLIVGEDGAVKLDADPEAEPTTSTSRFVRGLPHSANGVRVEINGLLAAAGIPEPPAEGTFVLTSTDGVLSWETQA